MKKLNLVLLFFLASSNIAVPISRGDSQPIDYVITAGLFAGSIWLVSIAIKWNNQKKKLHEETLAQQKDVNASRLRPATVVAVDATAEGLTTNESSCINVNESENRGDVSAFDTQTRSNENEGEQQVKEHAKNDGEMNFRDLIFYTY